MSPCRRLGVGAGRLTSVHVDIPADHNWRARRADVHAIARHSYNRCQHDAGRSHVPAVSVLMTKRPESTHPNADAFPRGLSGPALRALHHAGIGSMADLAKRTEREVADLHGMGPKGVRELKAGLAAERRRFRGETD